MSAILTNRFVKELVWSAVGVIAAHIGIESATKLWNRKRKAELVVVK